MKIPVRLVNNICRVCFKEIKDHTFYNLLNKQNIICEECFSQLNPIYKEFMINDVKATAIYEYFNVPIT